MSKRGGLKSLPISAGLSASESAMDTLPLRWPVRGFCGFFKREFLGVLVGRRSL